MLDTRTAGRYHLPSLGKPKGAAMDVQTISQRAGLPVRKIRYVLDQRILPGMRGRLQKQLAGRPRFFTDLEGYYIACAALWLEGGVKRKVVSDPLDRLGNAPWPPPGVASSPASLMERAVGLP